MNAPLRLRSISATADRVETLLEDGLERPLSILDLGCGSGHFSRRLQSLYEARGWSVADHLLAADIRLDDYGVPEVPACEVDLDRPLPFASGSFDRIVAIEVLEHVRAPFVLFAELRRVLKPGGRLIFTTPNVGNTTSRFAFFITGHFRLYPTPSTDRARGGTLVGHIQPLPVQYWHWGLRASGFSQIEVHADRIKRGASLMARLLWPVFAWGRRLNRHRAAKYGPEVEAEVGPASDLANAFETLSSRCLVVQARRD